MEMLKSVICDIAVVAVIAAFLDVFLPKGSSNYGVKMVFGLYFLAILLNPVISLFTETDLSTLDFTELSTSQNYENVPPIDDQVLETAAASLEKEISAVLSAMFEDGAFTVDVLLSEEDMESVTVKSRGIEKGKERFVADGIREHIASEYGIKKNKVKVVFT